MATNKKPRKKYTPKYNDNNAIVISRMRILFEALYKFFTDLKSGKCAVWKFDDVGYAPYVKLGDQIYAAFVFLQIFSDFAEKVFSYKNIKLDFAPLRDFAGYLCERNDKLSFDVSEINKAYAFTLKLHNIFRKEMTCKFIADGANELKATYTGLKHKMKE